jgi:hypothetical protein
MLNSFALFAFNYVTKQQQVFLHCSCSKNLSTHPLENSPPYIIHHATVKENMIFGFNRMGAQNTALLYIISNNTYVM